MKRNTFKCQGPQEYFLLCRALNITNTLAFHGPLIKKVSIVFIFNVLILGCDLNKMESRAGEV